MSGSVLITGATGFIGSRLVAELLADQRARIRVVVRDAAVARVRWPSGVEIVEHDLTSPCPPALCRDIDTIFHLAGHAHAEDEGTERSDRLHQDVTVGGTRGLLGASAEHRVSRFVFLSSVKALGEATGPQADDGELPAPSTAYGRAKRDAERLVVAAGGVVLRSPLVYGPGVKGNLRQMIGAINAGRFPPIPAVDNRRSMVDVRDVSAALRFLEQEPRATGRVFLATDGEAYSTRRIYEAMSAALGRPLPRWSIPMLVLRVGARVGDLLSRVIGRPAPLTTERLGKLFGNAHYSNRALTDLGFRPSLRLETSLPEMVAAWRAAQQEQR